MIDRLKKQFYKSGESLLNLLMQKIKILEINNNNYILYLNELKNLFEQYDMECVKLNKNKLTEESKIIYACAKFYKLTSNLYNIPIKTFKSDNGTEYINKNVTSFLNNHWIKFIHPIPGYPQQNGRTERLNQTINNYAITLLNFAKLPLSFWDSAVQCAAFLYNSNPHNNINF